MASNICINADQIICKRCGSVDNYTTERSGPHLKAICSHCTSFITFIATESPRLYFGRYKRVPIEDIENEGYLSWALITINLNKRLKKAFEAQLLKLRGGKVAV